jgi:hypothetical protein
MSLVNKCQKCFSKCNNLKQFESKLLNSIEGMFCDVCYQQSKERDDKQIQEITSRHLNVDLYIKPVANKLPTIDNIPLLEYPTITNIPEPEPPKQSIIQNITINYTNNYNTNNNINNNNTTNNNNNNITKNKYVDEMNDKKGTRMEKFYNDMVQSEEKRIREQKIQKNTKHLYSICPICKIDKHFEEYDLKLDKNEEPIVVTKMYGLENPTDEYGNCLYMRNRTCISCLKIKKKNEEINKPYVEELKKNKDNFHTCECGGCYFTKNKYNKTKHEKSRMHLEYIERQHIENNKDVAVSVDYTILNINYLKNICRLNGISGFSHMVKDKIIEAIKKKAQELQLEKKHIIMN